LLFCDRYSFAFFFAIQATAEQDRMPIANGIMNKRPISHGALVKPYLPAYYALVQMFVTTTHITAVLLSNICSQNKNVSDETFAFILQ
jgi:hypothetical protein